MTNLYESNNYDLSFRGILSNNNFKLYTNNDTITISSDINFDINADYRSSINYLASSILALVKSIPPCLIPDSSDV